MVAITGSAGKTTTKEVTAELLSARYRVFRNKGNLNNHIGLPLSLLELRDKPDVAVVELGMNHHGEIRTLVGIAEPDVRVWTNVGDAHLGFFESPDAIADAKGEILEHAASDTLLVANANDGRIMSRAADFAGRVVTFGIETPADVEARGVEALGLEGTAAAIHTRHGDGADPHAAARNGEPCQRPRRNRRGVGARRLAFRHRGESRGRCGRRPTAASCCGCPAA